jgi:DNA-binding NarL/FixJ family response regulator
VSPSTRSPAGPPAEPKPITIVVIDDNRIVRETLESLLSELPDFTVSASEHVDADLLAAADPQVVLLDEGLRDDESLRVAAIRAAVPGAFVILMDLIPVNEEVIFYVNAGVSGFILKDATFDEFVATIRAVASGVKVLPPSLAESLFTQIAKGKGERARSQTIDDVRMTRRESEVIGLIGDGLSNKEIATRLNIATHTVKSHVRNVMEKLALHTRLQIAAYSHRER